MEIKNFNYNGTNITALVIEDDNTFYKTIIPPQSILHFKILLGNIKGIVVDTIIAQIHPDEHLSEERLIINFEVNPITFVSEGIFINISDLNSEELAKYNEIKSEIINN